MLRCDFIAEPPVEQVQIVDLTTEQLVYEESATATEAIENAVEIKLDSGIYECKVHNPLGMASIQIQLEPKG